MIFQRHIITHIFLKAGAALLLTIAAAGMGHTEQASRGDATPGTVAAAGNCPPLASRYVVTDGIDHTTSTTYVKVPGTTVKFTQGGSKQGCVIVSFTADSSSVTNEDMTVQPLLDGGTVCVPNIFFNVNPNPGSGFNAHAMNFVCEHVAPGNHTIIVRYKSTLGGQVTLGNRTTIVHFVP